MSKRDFRKILFYEFQRPNVVQTARNINQVWGEGSVSEWTVQRWYQNFRSGNTSFKYEPYGSRPSTIGNDQLKVLIDADPRKTTRDVPEELNVDQSTVVRHLKQIGKTKKLDK